MKLIPAKQPFKLVLKLCDFINLISTFISELFANVHIFSVLEEVGSFKLLMHQTRYCL